MTNQKKVSVQDLKLLCLCKIKEIHRQQSREKQEMTELRAEVDQIQPMREIISDQQKQITILEEQGRLIS